MGGSKYELIITKKIRDLMRFRKEATSIVVWYLLFRSSLEPDGVVKNGAGSFTVNVDMVGASDPSRSDRPMSRTTSSSLSTTPVQLPESPPTNSASPPSLAVLFWSSPGQPRWI